MYQTALLTFLISSSFFILVLLYLIKSYFKELKTRGSSSYESSLKILDKARKESIDIIRDANTKSQQILSESYSMNKQVVDMVESRIEIVSDRQNKHFEEISSLVMTDFHKEVREETSEALQGLKKYFDEVNDTLKMDMSNYANTVKKDLTESHVFLNDVIKNKRLEIEKELDLYKIDRMKIIDTKVNALVDAVFFESLKTNISDKEEEKIVLGALELLKDSPEYKSL